MARLLTLGASAAQLLTAFSEQLTLLGAVPDNDPVTTYLAPGAVVAWDSENQLTMTLRSIDPGFPGKPTAAATDPRAKTFAATFEIALLRAVPIIGTDGPMNTSIVPAPADINQAGMQTIDDAGIMIAAAAAIELAIFTQAKNPYPLVGGPGEQWATGPVRPAGPSGGLAGVAMVVWLGLS